jgi:hypothetical protein
MDPADAESLTLLYGHIHGRWERSSEAGVNDPRGVQQRTAPLFEIDRKDAPLAQSVQQSENFPVRQPLISSDHDLVNVKHIQTDDHGNSPV